MNVVEINNKLNISGLSIFFNFVIRNIKVVPWNFSVVVVVWYDDFLNCDTAVIRLTCNFIVFRLDFKLHFGTTKV